MRVFRHSLKPVRHPFPYRRRSAEAFLARCPGVGTFRFVWNLEAVSSVHCEHGLELGERADALRLAVKLCTLGSRQLSRRNDPELDPLAALLALPATGGNAVDANQANARGSLITAAPTGSDQLLHALRNQLVALSEAHDVDVVLGQQPQARLRCREGGVTRKNVGAAALDIDLFELIAERVEERARLGSLERLR